MAWRRVSTSTVSLRVTMTRAWEITTACSRRSISCSSCVQWRLLECMTRTSPGSSKSDSQPRSGNL
eukprot:2687959-Alexandrium_andersonii.AAC.1